MAVDHDAINLSQGYPDFPVPLELLERLTYYAARGENQYPPMHGVPYLREQIAKKLRAIVESGSKHDIASVWANGKLIGTFGIRRSRKAGHPYIPSQIYVSEIEALRLASCKMTYGDYVDVLREKNLL